MAIQRSDNVAGARVVGRPRGRGQPKVAKLQTNKTLMVLPLNPTRAKESRELEVIRAPRLSVAAENAKPEQEYVVLDQNAAPVKATMRYGRDSPDDILRDFEIDMLVAKLEIPGVEGIAGRPMLRQRLRSAMAEMLLRTMDRPEVAHRLETHAERLEAAKVLEAEILRVKALAVKQRALLSNADSGEEP
jgi:hypothetical protein